MGSAMRLRGWAVSSLLLFVFCARAEDAPPAEPPAHELPGVTVEGKRNLLEESDRKLKELVNGLPCNGCDTKPVRPGGTITRIVDAVLGYTADKVLPTAVPNDSEARAKDPDPVRNEEEAAKFRPKIMSSPNNNP